jgi:metallo-beta-lactamase family protein
MKRGFEGPIYTHHATRALCAIMLRDSGYLQELAKPMERVAL